MDLLCLFLGIPKNVQAVCSNLRHSSSIEVEDSAECIIEFENGKTANVFATTNFKGHDSTILHLETKTHTIMINEPNIYVDGENLTTTPTETYMGKKCYGNSHIYLIKDFYDSLANGRKSPISLESAHHALKIIIGAYSSNGKTISLK